MLRVVVHTPPTHLFFFTEYQQTTTVSTPTKMFSLLLILVMCLIGFGGMSPSHLRVHTQ
ncbi:hypothetical protein RhiirA4_492970 [Rhizophagus irregularis]|uniref:Uncharacterized protein n=1 Tax=Rhizophagus irregularis TaxID=588596 RepID=A0A2I1HXF6_9GLOM|nr:hypothetical protein RhiirA4_492970 [Rhizophagus irregularis]